MATITNGAELVKKLRESGTGGAKLLVCTNKLEEIDKAEKRVATSEEIIAELEKTFPGSVTVAKARQFAETGEYNPDARPATPNTEDKFLKPAAVEGLNPTVGPTPVNPVEQPTKAKPAKV